MLRTLISVVTVALVLATAPAHASDDPLQLGWGDLVPRYQPLANPFEELALEDRESLAYIAAVEMDLGLGLIDEGGSEHEEAKGLRTDLESRGIDIGELMRKAVELDAEVQRRNAQTVGSLDGEVVRIPGYALPLEFSETGVRELLLVPYVGACIHSPPPPPNQIVFVELDDPHFVENLYDAVWITGELEIKQSSQSLSFVDGSADIATGYTLKGVTVEPYQ